MAALGGFSKAAEAIFITAPAVIKQINLLEEPYPSITRLAEKNSLTVQDLYGEDFMLIQRGWNQVLDTLRDNLWQAHPKSNIVDFDFFSLEIYNRCESSNVVLMTIDPWAGIRPLLKVLPVDWDYKMSFGLLHFPHPSPAVCRLLDAFQAVYL